jgi:hypothetical protein
LGLGVLANGQRGGLSRAEFYPLTAMHAIGKVSPHFLKETDVFLRKTHTFCSEEEKLWQI